MKHTLDCLKPDHLAFDEMRVIMEHGSATVS